MQRLKPRIAERSNGCLKLELSLLSLSLSLCPDHDEEGVGMSGSYVRFWPRPCFDHAPLIASTGPNLKFEEASKGHLI